MNLLINILKAVGIVIGGYFLLFAGGWAIIRWRFPTAHLSDFGVKSLPGDIPVTLLFCVVMPFLLALGALYLPPVGRMCAAIGALSLIAGVPIFAGTG